MSILEKIIVDKKKVENDSSISIYELKKKTQKNHIFSKRLKNNIKKPSNYCWN